MKAILGFLYSLMVSNSNVTICDKNLLLSFVFATLNHTLFKKLIPTLLAACGGQSQLANNLGNIANLMLLNHSLSTKIHWHKIYNLICQYVPRFIANLIKLHISKYCQFVYVLPLKIYIQGQRKPGFRCLT